MRVLYFTGAYRPNSMISHTHGELVAALRDRGIEIEMLSTAPRDQREAIAEIADPFGNRVWYVRPDAGLFSRPARAWSARRWHHPAFLGHIRALRHFFSPERRGAYDLLHVGMAYPYATILRRALGDATQPPTIVTTTGGDIMVDEETGYGYNRVPAIHRETGRTLRWAALVQANSPRSAEAVRGYGCPTERIVVQPPQSPQEPVPLTEMPTRRANARARLRAQGTIPEGRLLVGLGRMEPIKGYDDAIRALPAILHHCPDVTAIFAGPTRTPAAQAFATALTRLAHELGVSEHVSVCGQIPYEQVPDYIAAADLVLIPSLLDGLNKTGLEAAAYGTPVVVSERAGLAHYVRQHGAGEIVPPRSPDGIATAVTHLLTDTDAWQRASAGAHALAETFSLSRTATAIIQLYEQVLDGEKRAPGMIYSRLAARRAGGGDE